LSILPWRFRATRPLRGEHLAGGDPVVQIGGLPAAVKASSAGTAHRGSDLPVIEPGAAHQRAGGGELGRPAELILGRLPLVTRLAPQSGPPGTQVTIRGHGFDPDPRGDQVTIGGERALLLSASANEIAAIVPAVAATSGSQAQAPVVVQARGGASSGGLASRVASPSEAVFTPHYFAAAVPERPGEDVVFVSTELGPALLLGARRTRPPPPSAMRVAAGLNGVVAAAARPVVLRRGSGRCPAWPWRQPELLLLRDARRRAAYGGSRWRAGSGPRPGPWPSCGRPCSRTT
jgi:hypothetical protein